MVMSDNEVGGRDDVAREGKGGVDDIKSMKC